MAMSNVAPPHISRLKMFGVRWATASATLSMSSDSHARRDQRLVRIAQRRVGDEQWPLVADPCGEPLRPEFAAAIARALRDAGLQVERGTRAGAKDLGGR